MSDEEPWDAKKVAAECAASAREKTGPAPLRAGEPPPIPITSIDRPSAKDEFRDELGLFKKGNPATGAGRPTKYKPEYVDQARRLAQIGATNNEMADFFEVNIDTFKLWRNVHPEFNDAVKVGREKPDDRTERSLYETANGYDYMEEAAIKVRDSDGNERVEVVKVQKHQPPDPRAAMFWLSNRRPKDWQIKRTIEHKDGDRTVSPDEARKALADFYANGGEIIDVTPTRLTLPEPERVIVAEDDI